MINTLFFAGDVVTPKAGGPKMTVEEVGRYGLAANRDKAKCVWFEGQTRMEQIFEFDELRMV
jgi:uncharacterized protein YodC (DUF2158 family)